MNHVPRLGIAALCLLAAAAAMPAPGDRPVPPLAPSEQSSSELKTRTASLPARGLFDGDRLSAAGRQQLGELIRDALELQVEVALLVPTGPWKIDERASDERALTPARLDAVKRYLAERGIDPKNIYVESRIHEKLAEPRLDLQIVGRDASDWKRAAARPAARAARHSETAADRPPFRFTKPALRRRPGSRAFRRRRQQRNRAVRRAAEQPGAACRCRACRACRRCPGCASSAGRCGRPA
ncbi:MAG: hypothetical protein MZW92_73575 [Comamonadaceae bacterium]|nr:hypothetical protein [Comamonadaceae bacterium]